MDNDTSMAEGAAATASSSTANRLLDPAIFDFLKSRIEEDQQVRDDLTQIVQKLERATSHAQGLLSRVHGTPRSQCLSSLSPPYCRPMLIFPDASFLAQVEASIRDQIEAIAELDAQASKQPYYKYNQKWARAIQNTIFTVVFCGWLGGLGTDSKPGELGRLVTIEEVGELLKVPVNLKDRDAFHITIEEYLFSLIDLTQELSRLATNAVTLGDPDLSLRIASFVKDIFTGFQVLNLKNDLLRKRVDSVKYHVQRVEDVVYDLSLRGMVNKPAAESTSS
ncbi:translin [Plectosphaerella plurivora]|uniref:Translin n=1 Tax=Plectosphaerella plurivora TaxID=936078 RepID=A0A9P8VLC5_9PEZI|nr:translin [Plectosphaerella plurivora]